MKFIAYFTYTLGGRNTPPESININTIEDIVKFAERAECGQLIINTARIPDANIKEENKDRCVFLCYDEI